MDELIEPFSRLLEDVCNPPAIRDVEAGGDWRAMWQAIEESGFLDALVAEDSGGAGLTFSQSGPLLALLGHHAVPLPVGETMIARALLARREITAASGPIVLATGPEATPGARVAEHVLGGGPDAPTLEPLGTVTGTGLPRDLSGWTGAAVAPAFRASAAVLRAQLIAGAAARILDMTVAYANERVQFGKPIGRQQALQQQLAVMAEQVVAARLAAAVGTRGDVLPRERDAAVAKHGASVAAGEVAAIAHAVFGAIGISEEHDLQLFSRRLHLWRLSDGGAAYWAERLGASRLADAERSTIEWLTADVAAAVPA